MQLFDLVRCRNEKAGFIALGFFDSIHLGHQKVICKAVSLAKENGALSSVFLFRNNIYPLLGQQKEPLFSFEERVAEIEKLGVDRIFYIDADISFLHLSADEFISFLTERVALNGVICGTDFTFGLDGKGKASDLIEKVKGKNFAVDLLISDGEKVSTTLVKEALLAGDLLKASRLLGRPYSVFGKVIGGRKDGKKIGFPTVNLDLSASPLKKGVYFTKTVVDGNVYRSVTNVGAHPTFGDYRENIETHILDFDGNLYNATVEIRFLAYEREIVKFDRAESLIAAITEDEKKRRVYD